MRRRATTLAALVLAAATLGCGDNQPALVSLADAGAGTGGAPGADAGGTGGTGPLEVDLEARRNACAFHAGTHPAQTIGLPPAWPRPLPITHVIVTVQENHTFDSYFGRLAAMQPDIDGFPTDFANKDPAGNMVAPHLQTSTCRTSGTTPTWPGTAARWTVSAATAAPAPSSTTTRR
jgi:phospholipase C